MNRQVVFVIFFINLFPYWYKVPLMSWYLISSWYLHVILHGKFFTYKWKTVLVCPPSGPGDKATKCGGFCTVRHDVVDSTPASFYISPVVVSRFASSCITIKVVPSIYEVIDIREQGQRVAQEIAESGQAWSHQRHSISAGTFIGSDNLRRHGIRMFDTCNLGYSFRPILFLYILFFSIFCGENGERDTACSLRVLVSRSPGTLKPSSEMGA